MSNFLGLITNKYYWKLHSYVIKVVLKLYGIKIGKNFYIEGTPRLKIKGKGNNITIGNNVSIYGEIDIRNRENGKIFIDDFVSIDNGCRLVSACDSILFIGKRTSIGPFCIFNCGTDVYIGEDCLISGMIYFQASEHGFAKDVKIASQKHTYGKISIGNDVWIAAQAVIGKNTILEDGCVVGAKSLLRNCSYKKNSIIAGIPGKKIKTRR